MFRAYEPGRDRLVAVKVFRLDLTPEQSLALAAHFDALIAADISHPNIAAPIAAGLEAGAAYLVQEFAVGDSLDVVLRERGPMSIPDVVPLVESLASAIDHAASRGVRHGALHMRDIILSSDAARITGFGIADALSKIPAKLVSRPQYSHPDAPSDVYSLAAIAFEAVTGKRVSLDHLKDFEAAHGGELRGAFGVALVADPKLRPERAGDFASVLRDAAEMTAESAAPIAPAAPIVPVAPDLDLRIHEPADLMAEPEDDPVDRIIAATAQPPRALHLDDGVRLKPDLISADHHEPHGRRWPIVAVFLVFGIVAVLSVGFFLKSPTPVASDRPEPAVEETTVDLPPSAPPAATPAPKASPAPPPPTSSRPASGAVARTEKPARGSLLIRSTPGDADVFVNGRASGKTPVAVRDLALGSYTIRVAREGYVTEEQKLELTRRRPTAATVFNLRPNATRSAGASAESGTIFVLSRPAGARVFVNARLVGSTPLSMPNVPAGSATVRIELDGYRPWTTTVRVTGGEQARVAASLERQ